MPRPPKQPNGRLTKIEVIHDNHVTLNGGTLSLSSSPTDNPDYQMCRLHTSSNVLLAERAFVTGLRLTVIAQHLWRDTIESFLAADSPSQDTS